MKMVRGLPFVFCLTQLIIATIALRNFEIPRFSHIDNLDSRVDKHKSADYLLMPHIYRAFILAGSTPDVLQNYTVSNSCRLKLNLYYKALQAKKAWAWRMYDASGKQSSGVFVGGTTWTGDYLECLNNDGMALPMDGDPTDPEPLPQFCSVYMTHAPWMPGLLNKFNLPFPVPYSPFIVDTCLPINCSSNDIFNVVQAFLSIDAFHDNFTVQSVLCHKDQDITKDIPAFLSVVALFFILLLVVVGTTYDIYQRREKVRIKHGPEITIGYEKGTDKYGILKILMSPRHAKGRRGTLSSSELVNKSTASKKSIKSRLQQFHSEYLEGRKNRRFQSGVQNEEAHPPRLSRMNSAPASSHSQPISHLEGIPETVRENSQEKLQLFNDENDETIEETKFIDPGTPVPIITTVKSEKTTPLNGEVQEICFPYQRHEEDPENSPANENTTQNDGTDTSEASFTLNTASDDVFEHSRTRELLSKRSGSIIEVRRSRDTKSNASENLLSNFFLSFSFRKNTRHIMAEGSPDTLFCLNGVRVLSISWIVLGNVYGTLYQNPSVVDNHIETVKLTQTWWLQAIINTTLAADSFFILSGSLGAYHFLKIQTKEGKNKEKQLHKIITIKEYLFMIVHRLIRIFPCYAVLLLLATNVQPYLGEGPRWSFETKGVELCKKNWWANALFINNFYNPDDMCLPHTYYLANDFQFFLVSPVFLFPLLTKPSIGMLLIAATVVMQMVVVSSLNMGINGNVLRMKENNYWSKLYVKPYSRIGVYAIGLALGYFLFRVERSMSFRKIPLYIGWTLSLTILFMLPYITYLENGPDGHKWTGTETALYEAFSRPCWCLALSWLIFACTTNQGGFIGKFLSWNIFLPLCRITYGVYLLHPIVINVVIKSLHEPFHLNFGQLIYTFIAILVCSYGLAFVLISCVECPFTALESYVRLKIKARSRAKLSGEA